MRVTRTLLVVALSLLLRPGVQAQAQNSPEGSVTPDAAGSKAQGGDVLWYGKAPPGWGGVVTRIKMIASGVGWAERGGRFYWTTDNGANWTDITPSSGPDSHERISDIFFLDTHRGWALLARYDKDKPQFDLASTIDAGATWSRTQVTPLPEPADYGNSNHLPLRGWSGKIAFEDSSRGWLNATLPGETMNTWWSFLLVTADGGQTWKQLRDAPALADADMLLVSANEGWLLGRGHDTPFKVLFVTRDGARSWQQVSVSSPKEIFPATETDYQLPTFSDKTHGNLLVSYAYGENDSSSEVMFATEDGGLTWKPDRIVKNLVGSSLIQFGSATSVDSNLIFAAVSDHHPILTRVGAGADIDARTNAVTGNSGYRMAGQLSFATSSEGWVIMSDGQLMATTDGGATWTSISPGPQPHVVGPHGSFLPRQSTSQPDAGADPSQPAGSPGLNETISKHLGFDTDTTGSIGVMQAWWNFSPYHDVGIYLNGAIGHHPKSPDPHLQKNSNWVNTVRGMGWGLIPIWFGEQAPRIAKNAKDARLEGMKEADLAVASAQNASILPGGIIYYDMESYTCDCNFQVSWFLSGWISELHKSRNGYLGGAYVSASNADALLPENPDAVWVAALGMSDGSSRLASIWRLQLANGTVELSDSLFSNHQRIHQFDDGCSAGFNDCLGIPDVEWGGQYMPSGSLLNAQPIDLDIEDAPVVGGGGQKPIGMLTYLDYPFSVGQDCTAQSQLIQNGPGFAACSVFANGINNPQLSANPTEVIGDIVGSYSTPAVDDFVPLTDMQSAPSDFDPSGSGCPINPLALQSFGWTTGFSTTTPPPPPGFLSGAMCWNFSQDPDGTTATSINNPTGSGGAIVGYYSFSGGQNGGQACQTSNQSPATGTCNKPGSGQQYMGINDVGWISEITVPNSNNYSTISLLANGTLPVPTGGSGYGMGGGGINGFGQVAYSYYDSNFDMIYGQVFDYNGGNSSTPPISMQVDVEGINNNNEAVSGSNVTLIQDADTLAGTTSPGVSPGCPKMAFAAGINDWGQIVGFSITNTVYSAIVGDVCIPTNAVSGS